MPAKPETYMRWLRKRVSQTNSRCKRLGVEGRLDAARYETLTFPLHCEWCLDVIDDPRRMSLDHFVPLSAGGKNEYENIFIVHRACNLLRSDWDATSWSKFVHLLKGAGLWTEFKRRFKPRRFRR